MLANAANPDGNPLTAALVTQPANGQLTFFSDGSFQYTPNGIFWGTDSFTFVAVNGVATLAPATVTITVFSIPLANWDRYPAIQGQTLTISSSTTEGVAIFADTAADGTLLANALATGAPKAQVVFSDVASGLTADKLNWLVGVYPNVNTIVIYQGSFNPYLQSRCQFLGLQVFAANDIPTLVNDVQQSSSCVIGGVLANDVNGDGLPLTAQLVATTSYGALTFNADGSFSYTPEPGFFGTDSFTYSNTDGISISNTTTVTLIVYSVPVANPDAYAAVQGQPLSLFAANGLLVNDTNADGNMIAASVVTPPAQGSLNLTPMVPSSTCRTPVSPARTASPIAISTGRPPRHRPR